ncbi:MAG: hypothetical protein ABIN10_01045 [Specibacter sp.]
MPDNTDHLGELIGDTALRRIVALGTSAVFRDQTLIRKYWDTDAAHLDSGVQAHLYTRAEDIFVARIPVDGDAAERFAVALDVNHEIWRRFTGADLASSTSRVVMATGSADVAPPPRSTGQSASMTWLRGGLNDAVAAEWRDGVAAVLAFVPDAELLARLGFDADTDMSRRATVLARLMDKNHAMDLLAANGVACARTYNFEASEPPLTLLDRLPGGPQRYVVKPAGGAAGIGVFTDGGAGANQAAAIRHVAELRAAGKLPERFQVQEFLHGPVSGASMWLDGRGGCRVFEIHQQLFNEAGRFVGARWSRAGQAAQEADVLRAGRAMSAAVGHPLLVGIDHVSGVVLEVNPRVTAAAPIAHLLRYAADVEAAACVGIERIDLDTTMAIPYTAIASGAVAAAGEAVRARFGTLVLPQGLNPWGNSRVVFVNDDQARSARAAFARRLE